MIILSRILPHDNQEFDIRVKYDPATQTVLEIKGIFVHTHGNWYPIGNLMHKYFREAVEKLIAETDWVKIYNEFMECRPCPSLTESAMIEINH